MRVARVVIVAASALGLSFARDARADDATFALSVDVAPDTDGKPVRDAAWIDAQIEAAERLFVPLGVHFRWRRTHPLPARFASLATRADRDALRPHVQKHAISVFVVNELADVDEAGRFRMGVCWHHGKDGTRYLIVAASARPTVLAHELGHYFGLHHSKVVDNLMSYSRADGEVFLDDAQKSTVKGRAALYLRTRALPDVGPARSFL
ncbi:MAG: matrixin family metalloprotease [Myxococcales bacterium]|nr:matrixin family metalloprotease [Myxococcales bacterium]